MATVSQVQARLQKPVSKIRRGNWSLENTKSCIVSLNIMTIFLGGNPENQSFATPPKEQRHDFRGQSQSVLHFCKAMKVACIALHSTQAFFSCN
jgi:hypothetical protein